jgi:hypothetical protein
MRISFFKKNITKKRKSLFQTVISNPINFKHFKENKYLYRSLYDLCNRMGKKTESTLLNKNQILFIPVSKIFACSVSPNSFDDIIFIFPDLLKKLSCVDNSQGLAILAHEIGHLYYEHAKKGTPELQAQIEADDFAFQLGLGNELCEVLTQFKDVDTRTRISYLTSKILSQST